MSGQAERLLAGRYLLVEQLGHGGMGTVWRARDQVLGREVAVKELMVGGLPHEDLVVLHARMEQEARAAARVKHPGVVTVFDVPEEDGRPWIVMELIDGQSLADVIATEGTLLPRDAARLGSQLLSALDRAHQLGVLHRDVKPANVLLERGGRVVLTDFGILRHRRHGGLQWSDPHRRHRRFAGLSRSGTCDGPPSGPGVRSVVARRNAVRGGGGTVPVPPHHDDEHLAGGDRRGASGTSARGPARSCHRGTASQGPERAAHRRAGPADAECCGGGAADGVSGARGSGASAHAGGAADGRQRRRALRPGTDPGDAAHAGAVARVGRPNRVRSGGTRPRPGAHRADRTGAFRPARRRGGHRHAEAPQVADDRRGRTCGGSGGRRRRSHGDDQRLPWHLSVRARRLPEHGPTGCADSFLPEGRSRLPHRSGR